MGADAERKVIKEIAQLKDSVPHAKKLSTIQPQIKELKDAKNKVYGKLKEIRKEEEVLNAEMEAIRKELEQTKAEKDEQSEQVDGFNKQINVIEDELNALYKKKDDLREAYWKGRYDFKMQDQEIQHIQWMQRQKDRVLNQRAQA